MKIKEMTQQLLLNQETRRTTRKREKGCSHHIVMSSCTQRHTKENEQEKRDTDATPEDSFENRKQCILYLPLKM
jgi:hypothetical protein